MVTLFNCKIFHINADHMAQTRWIVDPVQQFLVTHVIRNQLSWVAIVGRRHSFEVPERDWLAIGHHLRI